MPDIKSPDSIRELPLALVKNATTLATSGFGVVVALAWNEAIKAIVVEYIDPYLGKSSGVISLIIYAMIMTGLAVVVTMQLSTLEKQVYDLGARVGLRKRREQQELKEAMKQQDSPEAPSTKTTSKAATNSPKSTT